MATATATTPHYSPRTTLQQQQQQQQPDPPAVVLNFTAIDEAYGPHSDLYIDILGVAPTATVAELQDAFWRQRGRLFAQLPTHAAAERRLDALVLAARILADDRSSYDALRPVRTGGGRTGDDDLDLLIRTVTTTPRQKMKKKRRSSAWTRRKQQQQPSQPPPQVSRSSPQRRNILRRRRKEEPVVEVEQVQERDDDDEEEEEEDDEEATLETVEKDEATIVKLPESQRPLTARLTEEVCGTLQDTANSLEQVFNAFTLQEEDIRAVMGRIDKAAEQIKKL